MANPLVTITIPTYKSLTTIERCLEALKRQTYKNIEINIIDSRVDGGIEKIATKFRVLYKYFPGSLLAARYEGVKLAKGKYTLIFDSDQILVKNAIKKAVEFAERKKFDMLVLEEDVYKKDTFVEILFAYDRKLINTVNDLSPFTGVIMPRFFRTSLLKNSYSNIPRKYFRHTGGPDHAIVYYEASLMSKSVGVVHSAVRHIEPRSIIALFIKYFRWGYTSVSVSYGKYSNLMKQKERFRTGLFTRGLIIESLGSILLLILKGVAFKLGYLVARLK